VTLTIPQGNSGYFDLLLNLTSGKSQSVNLTATGFPGLTTEQFNNSQGFPKFYSRLSFQTGADTPPGTYFITITGSSNGTTAHHPAQSPVIIITALPRDFIISSTVSQTILVQASRVYVPITITATGAFDGNVTLDAAFSPTAPEVGVFFNPYTVILQPNSTAQSTAEIIALKNSVGTYQLTITGTSSNPSRTHQIVIALRVSPCLIATATFGSELAPEVQFLRDFRDEQITQTFAGSNFMEVFNMWYYSFSPAVAGYEYSHATTRAVIKVTLYPLMGILHFASATYTAFGTEPEIAALVAGLVASSLIGLAYLALPLSGILWFIRARISGRALARVAKLFPVGFAVLIALFAVAEFSDTSVLMMAASAGLVLTTLLGASVLPALEVVQLAKRQTQTP
jgi:hypothetical protein